MINSLQAGRFIAAMMVVFYHAAVSVSAFVQSLPESVARILSFGFLGVDFFFVLSGFIIHYSMTKIPRSAMQFAYDRLVRVMLPYWPVAVAVAAAYTAIPMLSADERSWGWLSTLTLIPTQYPPALSVAWTLQHELVFYLLYAVLFFTGRVVFGLSIWAVCIVVANFWGLPGAALLRVILAPINVEFLAGVIVASMYLSGRAIPVRVALLTSAALMVVFAIVGGDYTDSWIVGLSFAALISVLCEVEKNRMISVPGWLVFGGAASYAIYLLHNPLLSLSSRLMAASGFGWFTAIVLSGVVSAAAGAAYYLMWERPAMRAVRRKVPPSTFARMQRT